MIRNTKKEYAWSRNKYYQVQAKIDKELGINLKEKLTNEGKSMASWISENAKEYLEKN